MISFALGVIVCAIVYTIFPEMAAAPSKWLRDLWDKFNGPQDPLDIAP